MKLSARNQMKGIVQDIVPGAVSTIVKVDIGGHIVTSSITNEAVAELGIKKGSSVFAVIKASDVMLGVE